jgi:uncharacterized membrane protein HdeD (DUF308 family)
VSSPDDLKVHASRYWPWVLLRAIPAIALAIVITFSQDHSTRLGFVTFGIFAALSGIAVLAGAVRGLDAGVVRWTFAAQGAIGVLAGVTALLSSGGGTGFLIFVVSAWAALTGFLELYSGLRSRRRLDSARDWLFAGGLTVLLAVAVLLVPADYAQLFTGPDRVERSLTASIVLVGLLGAYDALLGVYLVIAGLSLKWAGRTVAATAAESGN